MELVGGNSGTPIWRQMMEIVQNKHAIWVNRECELIGFFNIR